MTGDETAEPARPMLRVVRGDPTPEQLAALMTVLGARAAAGSTAPVGPRSAWNDPAALVRRPHPPGTDGWRRSARPR